MRMFPLQPSRAGCLTFAALALIFALAAAAARAEPSVLKIGLALPLSGAAAALGENTRRGAELYLGRNPEFARAVELVVDDLTTANLSQGVSAVRKLLEIDKVHALVMEVSPVTMATGPIIDKVGVPTIAITGADCARDRRYMVKLWMPARNEARALGDFIRLEKFSRVAIVSTEQDSMLARTQALLSELSPAAPLINITVRADEDIGVPAAKIAKTNPDVVVLNLMPGGPAALAKRLRELHFGGALISTVVVGDAAEIKASSGALRGAVYPDSALNPEFVRNFQEKYGVAPGLGAANGYDAMKLLHQAYTIAGNADRDALNRAIRLRAFSGALGEYSFSFDRENTYDLPAVINRVN